MATLFVPMTAKEVPFSNSALYVSVRVAPGSRLNETALDAQLGVRMALGATRADVRRLIIRSVTRPVTIGIVAGLATAWWLGKFLQAFVFEVDVRDPWTAGIVALILLATVVLGVSLPARRAANTDPSIVLRSQ